MQPLRLLTFGGLALQTDDGMATGASTRRHRLALLALLAVARARGISRDKLYAYLWPESDTELARHGLSQLLYFQRRHLDAGGLYLGRKTLRLNPDVIGTDVGEFEDALDAGAWEAAVRLYTGPFLDGFFLRDAPEFERWADDQRLRLEKRCLEAIRTLARTAAADGDDQRALGWWRRAAELNPLDTETVLLLVEASVAVGDRAAAVRHAQRHAELLKSDLDLAPDPRVIRMIARLRSS